MRKLKGRLLQNIFVLSEMDGVANLENFAMVKYYQVFIVIWPTSLPAWESWPIYYSIFLNPDKPDGTRIEPL
jgi:hypothetical protein